MVVPPRKRKQVQTMNTTSCAIGNCNVEAPTHVELEHEANGVRLHVREPAAITISVNNSKEHAMVKSVITTTLTESKCQNCSRLPRELSFQLLTPKSLRDADKLLLENALELYNQELPAMSFAANTGKESNFLRNCISNGKYCTLLLTKSGTTATELEVVGAVTYQILPPDTQFAEIPLAAVKKSHQRQGLGGVLFKELAKRMMDVGVLTLFCWGDQESETFWTKQGFLKVAEVDGRGKPHKLPLKAEIRKAMSLPGSATLMVCHLRAAFTQSHCSTTYISREINTGEKTPSAGAIQIHAIEEGATRAPSEATSVGPWVMRTSDGFSPTTRPCKPLKCSNVDLPLCTNLQSSIRNSANASIFCSQANTQGHDDKASRNCPCGKENRRPTAQEFREENSKNVKAGNKCSRQSSSPLKAVGRRSSRRRRGHDWSICKPLSCPKSFVVGECKQSLADECLSRSEESPGGQSNGHQELQIRQLETQADAKNRPEYNDAEDVTQDVWEASSQGPNLLAEMDEVTSTDHPKHIILFMNMTDETRRAALTQFVEKLGGRVTNEGRQCTHVVTGEVRRTLNFCTALCSGAWIVSPDWLKACSRKHQFVDERPFLLRDKQFEAKYKVRVADVVEKARQRPHSLLQGYYLYPTPHVQPPLTTIVRLAQAAGARILSSLDEAMRKEDAPHTIVVACEEDSDEALVASKAGFHTFSAEWFMMIIVKQSLELGAAQFIESVCS
ncbi:unnamed protein product [Sphagnum balticum]